MEREFKRGREMERERPREHEREREREQPRDQEGEPAWQPLRLVRRPAAREAQLERREEQEAQPDQREERRQAIDFDRFYREHHGKLLRYAMRDVDADEAKDVVHDALLKYLAHSARDRVPDTSEEAQWRMLAMVHDVLLDRRRTAARRRRLQQLISLGTAAMRRDANPRRRAEDAEIRRAIHAILQEMPACRRIAWTTVQEQGLSITQAAKLFELSPVTIRGYLHDANLELREALARQGITPATLRGRNEE